jgi:hypothetical protein
MRATMILLGAVAIFVATASASQRPLAANPSATALLRLPRATRAGETSLWGHVKVLVRKRGRVEMRFDPGLTLHGVTAEHAALEDTGSKDVPNDVYTIEEGHRLLTYVVPLATPVTILTSGPHTTKISADEFAQIVAGKNPKQRPLFGRPTDFGFWIRVGTKYPNPVLSIDEQYQP